MTDITDDDYVIVECALHSDVVKESARGLVRSEVEKRVGAMVDKVWEQVCRDALVGTFADFNEALFGKSPLTFARLKKTAEAAASINPEFGAAELDLGVLPFTLRLQARWFKEPRIGLQHLVHVLCGDIFNRAVSELRASVQVQSVSLGRLRDVFIEQYRGKRSHQIAEIRDLFELNNAPLLYGNKQRANLPLLAFSFKPRNGLTQLEFKRIAEGVLRAGFNLVEMDVRNVEFMDKSWREAFADVARSALNVTTHVARFSLNLSGPADLVIPYAEEFRQLHASRGPWVVKVDGGLDGMSTIQALRQHFGEADRPIITCYPILGAPLQNRIGVDTFRDMLVLSGADIIYPGGAPRIGDGDFVDRERDVRGVRRYRDILSQGWPMPSIAGGVHAGQLPAYFQIFGPGVCYFFGGGVALHLNGAYFDTNPITNPGYASAKRPELGKEIRPNQQVGGAELCRFAIEASAVTSDSEELRKMLAYTREHYVAEGTPPGTKFQFVNPKGILGGSIRSFKEAG